MEKLQKDYDKDKRTLRDVQSQLDGLNKDYASYDEQNKKDLEDARNEVEDLSELVKMKDRMLDDQNITIGNYKQQIKAKDEELATFQDSKNKYRQFYEDKL